MVPPKRIWTFYGHVHNDRDEDRTHWSILRTMERSFNCCVEVNNYMPVTFDELVANNQRWRRE